MKTKSTIQKLKRVKNAGVRNLYKHDSGKYYMRGKIKGRHVTASLHTNDLVTAKRLLLAKMDNLEHEQPAFESVQRAEMPTLETLCSRFLETKAGKTKGMLSNYKWVIGRLKKHFHKFTSSIDSIRASDFQVYFVELGLCMGPRGFNHFTEIVGKIFQLAVADGYLDAAKNPFLLIPKNDRRKRMQKKKYDKATIPTLEQFQQIVSSIRSQKHSDTHESSADFVSFFSLASVGEAETSSVNWQDIDWTAKRINFIRQKTHRPFYVPFFPWLKPFLIDLWERSGKPTAGKIFTIRSAKQAIYKACKRLGFILFSPRDFRIMGIWRQCNELSRTRPFSLKTAKLVSIWQGHNDGGKLILEIYTAQFDSSEDEFEQKMIEEMKG